MTKFDEDFLLRIGGAAMAPVLIALAAFWVVIKFRPETWTQLWVGRAITGLAFVVTLALAMRWALRALMRYRDDRLGYCRDVVD